MTGAFAELRAAAVTGSTRASKAATIPGSVSVSDLRPPPGLRTRPCSSGLTPPARTSTTPRVTVGRDTPAAAATAATRHDPTR